MWKIFEIWKKFEVRPQGKLRYTCITNLKKLVSTCKLIKHQHEGRPHSKWIYTCIKNMSRLVSRVELFLLWAESSRAFSFMSRVELSFFFQKWAELRAESLGYNWRAESSLSRILIISSPTSIPSPLLFHWQRTPQPISLPVPSLSPFHAEEPTSLSLFLFRWLAPAHAISSVSSVFHSNGTGAQTRESHRPDFLFLLRLESAQVSEIEIFFSLNRLNLL